MTRRFLFIVAAACLMPLVLSAANPIDGKWKMEPPQGPQGPGGQGGGGRGRGMGGQATFDLKADGSKLTGKIIMTRGEQTRETEIQEGKIEGSEFSFKVHQNTPRGEMTLLYSGKVDGDELNGERQPEGFDRKMPFRATREK